MKIDELIDTIQFGIKDNKEHITKNISHPALLISSLKKLKNVIGNNRIKNEISSQISHIIADRDRARKDPNRISEDAMNNVILSGPPGVGKTMIARILSEIYFSLGVIKSESKKKKVKIQKEYTYPNNSDNQYLIYGYILLLIVLSFGASFLSGISYIYRKIGFVWFAVLLLALVIMIIVGILYFIPRETTTEIYTIDEESGLEKDVDYSQIFVETSKNDFVGQYVGHSVDKTDKILRSCIGKVLFIDEAYSLITTDNDSYGIEATNHITQFLSQHPGELIVIIAGYQNKLQETIFKANPGLERRFMWKFNCDGYTANELFDIFKYKCTLQGWMLDNENGMKQLFINNYPEAFISFGGDVERLVEFCKLIHDSDYIMNGDKMNTFTYDHVQEGIDKLLENKSKKIESGSNTTFNASEFTELLSRLNK